MNLDTAQCCYSSITPGLSNSLGPMGEIAAVTHTHYENSGTGLRIAGKAAFYTFIHVRFCNNSKKFG